MSASDLKDALRMALAWIDAVPKDAALPAMPGFDRDYVNDLLAAPLPAEQPSNPVLTEVDIDELWLDCLRDFPAHTTRWQHFARQIEARIVGQQTKESGNG